MAQPTLLITGSNRGIGLEFVRQYAEDGWSVIACCRDPALASSLVSLAAAHPNIMLKKLDVSNFAQIDALAQEMQGAKIDVLINNAGVYPEGEFGQNNFDQWAEAFRVNSMAPLKMAEAFLLNIAGSDLKKIVTLSSKMGSLDDNTSGGSYPYRTSKVAANMVMKSLAVDLAPHHIASCILHPGWVLTDMGGSNALISAEQSVKGLRQVIEKLTVFNSGRFLAYDGKEIPW